MSIMEMLFSVFLFSLVTCLVLTPLLRPVALRCGLVDHPDGRRKIHAGPTPLAGGVAVMGALGAGLALVWLVPSPLREYLREQGDQLLGLSLALVTICLVGILDDRVNLRGRHKLFGQLLAVSILISFDVVVQHIRLFGWTIDLGLLSVPFTVFLLLGAINSLNFLDGMDGMLSSVGIIISLALAAMAVLGGHWLGACVACALAGALVGFLRYNFPPASTFLGDSGSMSIGLTIGFLAIQSSLKGPATLALIAPLATLTIPILDMTAALVRRQLTGRGIWATDRGHLHHRLLGHGLSNRVALLVVSFFCLLTAGGALASLAANNELFAVITTLAVIGIFLRIRLFGHGEFNLVRQRAVVTLASLLRLSADQKPKTIEIHLHGSADWTELWNSCIVTAQELNLKTIRLDVNAPEIHEGYNARWICPSDGVSEENPSVWHAEVPLMVGGQRVGHLAVTGFRDDDPVWRKMAELTTLAERVEGKVRALADTQSGQPAAVAGPERLVPRTSVEIVGARNGHPLHANAN
jgi:UDP-GlcNAc:undecaprenyl-phosphate GlcNAc-1-phosphate transferase